MIRTKFLSVLGIFFIYTSINARVIEDTTKLNEDLSITKIEEGVFIVTHRFPWPANSLLVKISQDGFILVDTPWENGATKLLIEWIRNNFSEIKLRVINTHFHRDNLGGNGCLLSQNIPVYGSDLTVKLLAEKGAERRHNILKTLNKPKYKRFYEAFKNTELKPPNNTFNINKGLKLKFGEEEVEVFYPGPAHTPDNVVVYFPKYKILFGGCMIKSLASKTLGFTGDADLKEWPNSIRKLLEKYKDCKIVVPGHGKWGDLSLMNHTIELLEKK